MAFQESIAVRNARLDAIEVAVGVSPRLIIYSGAVPANCAAADPAGVLATIVLPSDWMAAAAAGSKAMLGAWSVAASAGAPTNALSWRIKDSTLATCHMQGTITATGGGGDMTLDNVSITAGQTVTVNSFTITAGNS